MVRARKILAVDVDLAVVAAEAAMISAADAVLRIAGFRVRGVTGSHEARYSFPGLPPAFADRRLVLDRAREGRDRILYDGAEYATTEFAASVVTAAAKMLKAARVAVESESRT